MQADLAQRIAAHPKYQELKAKRTSFGWVLTIAMLAVTAIRILVTVFARRMSGTYSIQ